MRGKTKNINLLVIFLLIVSVAISSLYISKETKETEKVKKEQASKNSKEESPRILPSEIEAVVPFFEFDLIKDLYLILKFDFKITLHHEVHIPQSLYISKYFKTLFCFVISPNAP